MRSTAAYFAILLFVPAASAAPLACPTFELTVTAENWNQEEKELNEITTYLNAAIPAGRSARFDIQAGRAAASTDNAGDLSGFTNTRARGSYFVGDNLVLRAGISLPTGKTEYDTTETEAIRLLSDRFRGYRGYRLGEGTGFEVGTAYSVPVGPATLGLGVGYSIKGKYTPFADRPEYDPGDQILLTGGLDAGNEKWSCRINYIHVGYGPDEQDGEEVFRVGTRNEIRLSVRRRAERATLYGTTQLIGHGNDEYLVDGALTEEAKNSNGRESYWRTGADYMWSRKVWLLGYLGGRNFADNDQGFGGGNRIDVGAGTRLRVSDSAWLSVEGRYSRATLNSSSEAKDDENFSGFMGSAGIRYRL